MIILMSQKKDIWNHVTNSLESKLSQSEFRTWFPQTTLKKLNNNMAIVEVPNKFVANWLSDKYLPEIQKAFKEILKQSPEIHFIYAHQLTEKEPLQSPNLHQPDPYQNHHLNPAMTFNRFIIGENNRFAYSSALEVAKRPSDHYNPFYIFSASSVGKTHLLHAIGNYIISKDPFFRLKYISSEHLILDFNLSQKNKKYHEFREKYQNMDLLLFDDIQLLARKKKIQEEFLSLFDSLYGSNKQIVVVGDKSPNRLNNMSSQLRSRLGSGLLTEIQNVDQKTKINIIKKKLKEENYNIPDDIILFLSKNSPHIKALIKNVVRIQTYFSLNNEDINISTVKSLITNKDQKQVGVDDIKSITAGYFNISLSEMISHKKQRVFSYPRQLAMYLSRKYTDLSYKEIGYSFGRKDHSTVIYSVRRLEKLMNKRKDIKEDLMRIEGLFS